MAKANAINNFNGKTRYARQAIVVVDVFPEIMREIALDAIKPTTMYNQLQNLNFIKDKLSYDEKLVLPTLLTDGYNKCDTILLYKLVRQQLPKPGKGWGKAPLKSNLGISDDVERIRIARNRLLHRPRADMSETEEIDFFQEITEVVQRIDKYLKKQTNGFESRILDIKKTSLDLDLENKYVTLVHQMEELTLKYSAKRPEFNINIFLEREATACIASKQEIETEGEKMTFIVTGVADENQIVERINELRDVLNKKQYNIQIQNAQNGSIILHVIVPKLILLKEDIFYSKLVNLMRVILKLHPKHCDWTELSVAVYKHDPLLDVEYEEIVKKADEAVNENDPCYNPDDLILNVSVKDTISREQLYHDTANLVTEILPEFNSDSTSREDVNVILCKRKTSEACLVSYRGAQLPIKLQLPYAIFRSKVTFEKKLLIYDCVSIGRELICTDYHNRRLVVSNSDGTNYRDIRLTHRPYGITKIDDNTVAVSTWEEMNIHIIDISTGTVQNTFKVSGECYGLSYNDGLLYIVVNGSSVEIMNLNGKTTCILPLTTKDCQYITCARNKLYFTEKNTLFCMDLNGTILWQFTKDHYRSLCAVTTDRIGNVYVTCYRSDNILVISSDGKNHRQLLNKSDGISRPSTIYYDKLNDFLLVNISSGTALLFDIKMRQSSITL